jgi:TolB protein
MPLSQVKVPHSYYWREMYVPQVTTGPGSFTWSPDSKEMVYSMQGTLWRQYLGAPVATQITSGPNYDFQPDWSPDGRSIVFSTYDGRAYSLALLDVPTGERRTLLEDGAVNVDARWSPDGTRLAWVSTAFNGRFHVFVGRMTAGRLDSVTRITEDKDSGLPRYYYSAFDHYLSPTWSPDGKEIILVSNRDHIYGTGGLWRMEARPDAPMREIHYEETTWKMRPDWSRDGTRIVYSGYHGRQWNQLWITRSEKADPLPLTYGDFDATAPRWSPDGTRIGFISNAAGNTSLWTLTMPGGKRTRIDPASRRYRDHVGQLIVTVLDSVTRQPMPARVSVRDSAGKFYAPDRRIRHADEAIQRDGEHFEYGYWHTSGVDTLTVPAGRVTVEVWRGPEWKTLKRPILVRADQNATARLTVAPLLPPLSSLRAQGWWSADLHVHMNYGGAYKNTPARLAAQARAEGVSLIENLVVNKEQRIPDIGTWDTGPLYRAADLWIVNGQEFHTGLWGHTSQLGLRDFFILPDYAGYPGTAFASLYPTNAAIFDISRGQGGLNGYVHPFDFAPDLAQIQGGVPYELPVDAAAGRVDFIEVMGYSDHLITSDIWYKLLNCGFRIPAAAGTDAFPNFAQLRGPPGLVRTFAKIGPTLDHRRFLDAIKAGRTMVTNAPLVTLTVNGRDPGTEIKLPFKANELTVRVTLRSPVPVERLELVANGKVVARLRATDTTFKLTVDKPTWILARAWSARPRLPVLDLYPFGTTSPVYITMGNTPVSCGADAEYFLRWINLLSQRVRADTNWNTAAERESALSLISRAHEEFIRRR